MTPATAAPVVGLVILAIGVVAWSASMKADGRVVWSNFLLGLLCSAMGLALILH